jgi:predicted metal-dependent hydrolase
MEIVINDLHIEAVRKQIKNIHLGVYPPDGRVRVAFPQRISEESLRLFLISKMAWIHKQRAKFEGQARQSPREYITGESHYFEGKRYLLRVIENEALIKVEVSHTHLDFYVPMGATTEQKEKLMLEWYRKNLKERAEPLIKKWEEKIGVQINEWGTKQMRTKWGTCNIGARRIWLNVELAKKPLACLEYVVVHELVHLLERNHNNKFKAHMDNFLPNWRHLKEELNRFVL